MVCNCVILEQVMVKCARERFKPRLFNFKDFLKKKTISSITCPTGELHAGDQFGKYFPVSLANVT